MVGACKLTRTGMIQDLLRLPHARGEMRQIKSLAERVAGDFGLAGDLPARTLPAGQRRILEIARALVGEPRLLMLDEPSAGLNREEMQQLIAAHPAHQRGRPRHPPGLARHGVDGGRRDRSRAQLRRDHRQGQHGGDPAERRRPRSVSRGLTMLEVHSLDVRLRRAHRAARRLAFDRRPRGGRDRRRERRRQDHAGAHHLRPAARPLRAAS